MARLLGCGLPSAVGVNNQNGIDVQVIVIWQSVFLFFWKQKLSLGLGLDLGVGLVASLLVTAGCRFTIPRYRDPATSSQYATFC